jgi:hypothetical protein
VVLNVDQLKALEVHPLLSLIRPVNPTEMDILTRGTAKYGTVHPILVNGNRLLDGRARLSSAIKNEQCLRAIKFDVSEAEEREIIRMINIGRRNMGPAERAMLAARLVINGPGKWSKREAARFVGDVSPTSVCQAVEIINSNDINLIAMVEGVSGESISIKAAQRLLRSKQAFEKNRQAAAENPSDLVEIRHGDCFKVLRDIPDNSVRLFLTDVMFAKEFEKDHENLGRLMHEKLAPGGSGLVMMGNGNSLSIGSAILRGGRSLKQHWECGAVYAGETSSFPNRMVINCWRPVYWFVKTGGDISSPKFVQTVGEDTFKLLGKDTLYSEYGQKPESFTTLIERLTEPGDLVVDPFCGGGAIPAACQLLGRRCIGSEINTATFQNLVSRFFGMKPEQVDTSDKIAWGSVMGNRPASSESAT